MGPFVSISSLCLLQDCSLRGTIPLALVLCLKASIKPTYTENIMKGERRRDDRGQYCYLIKQWQSSVVRPSLSFPPFVIPSRSTAVAPLHSTASSTCLFTYSPVPHPSTSLLLTVSPSLILWIIPSIFTLSSYPSILPLLPCPALSPLHFLLFFAYLNCMKRDWGSMRKVIWNTGHR